MLLELQPGEEMCSAPLADHCTCSIAEAQVKKKEKIKQSFIFALKQANDRLQRRSWPGKKVEIG